MSDLPDELKQYATHEKRLRDGFEYRVETKACDIYGDINEFKQFIEDYQLQDELLNHLFNLVSPGSKPIDKVVSEVLGVKSVIDRKIIEVSKRGM